MSGNKAIKYNMFLTILSESVTLISGLIMPRLVLLYFGSTSNGLVSSIAQFLGFSTILRAGMGGAIRAALYEPLATNDEKRVSSIMSACDKHMKKIGLIIGFSILCFAFVYPFIVADEYEWFYAFSMVLIIGAGTFVENLFGIKCKILLQADQKYYITIGAGIITNICIMLLSIVMLTSGCSIRLMKVGTVIAGFISPILLNLYVKKNYRIDWKAKPDNESIKERWNAFFQQVAVVVNENVDLTVLTLFVALKEISVYTVHSMIAFNMARIVNSCVTGINSTFGDLLARKKYNELKSTFLFFEWLVFAVAVVLYSVTAVMISPFVSLYTASIVDVNYYRPVFSFMMVIVVLLSSSRIPYQMLVEGAGRFRETRNGAAIEAVMNIVVSVLLVWKFGLVGVLIGTVLSSFIRTIEYAYFSMKNILHMSFKHIVRHYLILFFSFAICFIGGKGLSVFPPDSYLLWAADAAIVTVFSCIVVIIVSILFYRQEFKYFVDRLFKKRRGVK